MRKIKRYFKGVAEEAHRVRWPHKKEFWGSVSIVLIITVISALVILAEDFLTIKVIDGFEDSFGESATSAGAAIIQMIKWRF